MLEAERIRLDLHMMKPLGRLPEIIDYRNWKKLFPLLNVYSMNLIIFQFSYYPTIKLSCFSQDINPFSDVEYHIISYANSVCVASLNW